MIEIKGKYNTAKVFNKVVEESAYKQILNLCNYHIFKGEKIRVMPDVHAGAGCTIGFTSTFKNKKIIPNLIGVDIGCGVLAYKIENCDNIDFKKFDDYIRENIPSGMNVGNFKRAKDLKFIFNNQQLHLFFEEIEQTCYDTNQIFDYVIKSIGTLGGGNHFIELNKDKDNNIYICIHSGSRNFGYKIAQYYQDMAKRKLNKNSLEQYITYIKNNNREAELSKLIPEWKKEHQVYSQLEYLVENDATEYLSAVNIAQGFARLNRLYMMKILCEFFDIKVENSMSNLIESVHNYIDVKSGIIRKGAISAKEDELLIIPLNMRDGSLLCKGKGNSDWNFSAPHGCGRLMSRSKAKEELNVKEYENTMKDVWSSCIGQSTLDEAPMAYKDYEEIMTYVEPTVEIIDRIIPIYNFKAE